MVEHFVSDKERVLVVQKHPGTVLDHLGREEDFVPDGSGGTAESLQAAARKTFEAPAEPSSATPLKYLAYRST